MAFKIGTCIFPALQKKLHNSKNSSSQLHEAARVGHPTLRFIGLRTECCGRQADAERELQGALDRCAHITGTCKSCVNVSLKGNLPCYHISIRIFLYELVQMGPGRKNQIFKSLSEDEFVELEARIRCKMTAKCHTFERAYTHHSVLS